MIISAVGLNDRVRQGARQLNLNNFWSRNR